jgi:hypothetical protein
MGGDSTFSRAPPHSTHKGRQRAGGGRKADKGQKRSRRRATAEGGAGATDRRTGDGRGKTPIEFEALGKRSTATLIYRPVNEIDSSPA